MQNIFDLLEDEEELPAPDEGLEQWKKQKSDARARMVTMQKQP